MEVPHRYHVSRAIRTLSSEIFDVRVGQDRIATVDVHYSGQVIYATVVLLRDFPQEEERALVEQLDFEVFSSYLPPFARQDCIVTVYRGSEISGYSDTDEPNLDDLEDLEAGFRDDFDDDFDNGLTRN